LALSLPAAAAEWGSEGQEIHFSDVEPVFDVLAFDTGYLPSLASPISVRFHITPTGGLVTDMDCESRLEWPEALRHTLVGIPDSGWFGVDAAIEMEAEVHIDIFGLWTGSANLWSEYLEMDQGTSFDPPLLGERIEGIVNNQDLVDPFEYGFTVFVGLEIVLSVAVYPELKASLEGAQITTDGPIDSVYQEANNSWQTLGMPADRPADIALTSTYWAEQTSILSLIIEPAVSLDTLLGEFELLSFPIPIPFVDTTTLRAFDPVDYTHPLPATAPMMTDYDFGDVPLGLLVNLEIPIENIGLMGLEGTISIEGDGTYSVYPESIYAQPGVADGIVVTFAPTAPGLRAADLIFESNDPGAPVQIISLLGNGWTEPPDDEPPRDDGPPDDLLTETGDGDPQSCGCESTHSASWAWTAAFALIPRRRRT
jgi:hypothetical protein